MVKVKVIEKYDAKNFELAMNEADTLYPSFATQTHVVYDKEEDCLKYIGIIFLTKPVK